MAETIHDIFGWLDNMSIEEEKCFKKQIRHSLEDHVASENIKRIKKIHYRVIQSNGFDEPPDIQGPSKGAGMDRMDALANVENIEVHEDQKQHQHFKKDKSGIEDEFHLLPTTSTEKDEYELDNDNDEQVMGFYPEEGVIESETDNSQGESEYDDQSIVYEDDNGNDKTYDPNCDIQFSILTRLHEEYHEGFHKDPLNVHMLSYIASKTKKFLSHQVMPEAYIDIWEGLHSRLIDGMRLPLPPFVSLSL